MNPDVDIPVENPRSEDKISHNYNYLPIITTHDYTHGLCAQARNHEAVG